MCSSGSVSTMNVVTSSSLSAIGSSHAPNSVFCPDQPRDQAVEQVGDARHAEDDERRCRCSRRSAGSPRTGISSIRSSVSWFAGVSTTVIGRRPSRDGNPAATASASSRSTVAMASAPAHDAETPNASLVQPGHHAGRHRRRRRRRASRARRPGPGTPAACPLHAAASFLSRAADHGQHAAGGRRPDRPAGRRCEAGTCGWRTAAGCPRARPR